MGSSLSLSVQLCRLAQPLGAGLTLTLQAWWRFVGAASLLVTAVPLCFLQGWAPGKNSPDWQPGALQHPVAPGALAWGRSGRARGPFSLGPRIPPLVLNIFVKQELRKYAEKGKIIWVLLSEIAHIDVETCCPPVFYFSEKYIGSCQWKGCHCLVAWLHHILFACFFPPVLENHLAHYPSPVQGLTCHLSNPGFMLERLVPWGSARKR